ncbi:hypothetical protein LTR05_008645 [Lithohypha guttulata]|uniref:Uncharacterized protein n=1 Tax=Lithohypha guttulata TaxID=1690604 RepID=A0AAN7PJM7_9EURO|nr:hypothetical protein LTR05_008645 [Lithohypha guttulata]
MEPGSSGDRDRDGDKDDDYMTQIMFDHPGMRRSRYYFRVLQFLRIMDESVVEMRLYLDKWGADLRLSLKENLSRLDDYCSSLELGSIFEQWEVMKSEWEEGMDQVRQRIARKQTEVQSLRDVLFTATSVREALQARHTNQNIMIFTVVTIIYLPLSLVTAVFGMHNLSSSLHLSTSMTPYAIALVTVSMSTYCFALLGLDWYRNHKTGTSRCAMLYRSIEDRYQQIRGRVTAKRQKRGDEEAGEEPSLTTTWKRPIETLFRRRKRRSANKQDETPTRRENSADTVV